MLHPSLSPVACPLEVIWKLPAASGDDVLRITDFKLSGLAQLLTLGIVRIGK